ncbi:MAG: hypothetical protein N3G20_01310, partial [Verrucomicrobiae bacterium]|nr:hypothetical protein [Verrucomicrobiae bacterium]
MPTPENKDDPGKSERGVRRDDGTNAESAVRWDKTAAAGALHDRVERISEGLILLTVVFGPWAFGCTQPWAIWTMNIIGYALGALLLAKHGIRLLTACLLYTSDAA